MIQNNLEKGFRYSIRKRSIGVCGVVIATFLLSTASIIQNNTVKATEPPISSSSNPKTEPTVNEQENTPNLNSKPEEKDATTVTEAPKADVMENLMRSTNQADKDLNKYLFGLNYNKIDILTRRGEAIENYSNTSSKQQGNEFVVIEKVKKSISNNSADVSINGNSDIFLGALFRADQGLFSVDLPGMAGADSYTDANTTVSGMQEGINTLVNRWNANYASSNPAPARMQYDSTSAYSMNQLKAKFGSNFEKNWG